MPSRLTLLMCCVLCAMTASCSKRQEPAKVVASSTPTSTPEPAPPAMTTIDEEPPESALRELMFRRYALLEEHGGLPVTVTATGQSGTLRSKLYEVRKEQCKKRQHQTDPSGLYVCDVNLMVTVWWDGRREDRDPSPKAEGMSVIKDASGAWVDCDYPGDKKSVCTRR